MKFSGHLTAEAERDVVELYRYVAANDAPAKARRLPDAIEKEILRLDIMPARGHCPPELERIGVPEFREVFYKPYRIIYEIVGSAVFVHCVLDGRRDLVDLLQERLLR
jgi:toxin ParE1/3/4